MTNQTGNNPGFDRKANVAKSLFLGTVQEANLYPFPEIRVEEAETLRMVLTSIDKFMAGKIALFREYDQTEEQPQSYLESLKELGLFGLIIPEAYHGIGFSNSAYSRVMQQISKYDASTAVTLGAHSSIGLKGLLLFGTETQKKKYLPKLASGETIAAFCLTEPGAGSDAASITTKATRSTDGNWILNGEKIWISNGTLADFYTVFARTDSPKGKISAFIVERSWMGVKIGHKESKLGIRASATTSVSFENVLIPPDCLLGEEGMGFKMAMAILNNGRTGLGGGAIGGMKECIQLAAKQARERKQFGQSISEFALVKKKIAQMTVNCFAAESVVRMVAHYIDSRVEDYSVEAAISKVYSSQVLWHSANEALQIAGGNGYMKDFPYEMILRDSRVNLIFEGTNEILHLYIALSGMKDAGEYLKDVGKSVSNFFLDPIKGFGILSSYATKKLSQITPLRREKIHFTPEVLDSCAEVYNYYTLWLSRATEALLRRYGKDLVGRQLLSQRLAGVAIDLFVGLCVLSRVSSIIQEKKVEYCKQEIAIAKIFTDQAKRRMNQNLRRLERPEDELMEQLSDFVVESGGYGWDTL